MPDYTFDTLSDYEFELLARDLLQTEMQITLENFKRGRDKGIDLRYARDEKKTLIVQCKHYSTSGTSKLKNQLKKQELLKVNELKPKRYLIVTSVGLNPQDKIDILNIFAPYCKSTADIYGRDEINNLLGKFPNVEKQHYKLWLCSTNILDNIVHSAVVNRTRVGLEIAQSKMKYYVQNQSYFRAKDILDEYHYCIIAGIPGIGKTTLAEVLFLDYVQQGFEPVRIYSSIEEAFEMLKPGKRQVFYFDDFLGQTTFEETSLGKNQDKQLLEFLQKTSGESHLSSRSWL